MQGNSLLEDFHGYTLNMADLDDGSLIRENSDLDRLVHDLHHKQDAYLREARPRDKDRLKKEVEADIVRIFDTFIRRKQAPYFAELDGLQAKARVIPDKEQRREYISRERLGTKYGFNAEKMERELLELTHGYKPRDFFPWQLYFADVFRDHSGFDITIGNPPYVRADSGELHLEMRQRLIACGRYQTL